MWQAPGSVETLQRGNCAAPQGRKLQGKTQGTACPSTDTARRTPAPRGSPPLHAAGRRSRRRVLLEHPQRGSGALRRAELRERPQRRLPLLLGLGLGLRGRRVVEVLGRRRHAEQMLGAIRPLAAVERVLLQRRQQEREPRLPLQMPNGC